MAKHLTRDHGTIRQWAEERGGKPAALSGTPTDGESEIIQIDFSGLSEDASLEEISWEEWFRKFDEHNLVLLYQEKTSDQHSSNVYKLINVETATTAAAADITRPGHLLGEARGSGEGAAR